MNRYPAKPIMDEMAKHGRYGDTMLVHMNPIEVAGIASLSPTGSLTTNPVTGQPEAFLPLLAPALGVLGGALKLGTLGTAALTGIGTAAVTGDLKRGLISGLTAGVSSGIGDLLTEGAQAGVEAATTNLSDTALNQAIEGTAGTLESGVARALEGATGSVPGMGGDIAGQLAETKASMAAAGLNTAPTDIAGQLAQSQTAMSAALGGAPQPSAFDNFSGRVDDLVGGLGTQGQLVGGLVGSSMLEQMDVQDDFEAQQRARQEESDEKRMRAYQDLQGAYRAAQPGATPGMSPMRAGISNLIPPPYVPGMQEGGSTSANSVEPTEEEAAVLQRAQSGALTPEDQAILQGYYARRNEQLAQNQADEDAAAQADLGIVDGVFRIAPGASNKEALDALYRAGLIPQDDYNWFSSHLRQTDNEDSQYLASEGFPGVDRYLEQNDFNEENQARVRRIVGALGQAQSEEGIAAEDINYLTEGAVPNFGFFGAGGNAGYGGIDPVSIQAGLRGNFSVAPPPDYMAGFEPEFSYFQDDPNNIRIPTRMFRPTQQGIQSEGEYFDPILDKEAYLQQLKDYYTNLANYTPAPVEYPEESESIPDDPDPVGPDPETGDPDDGYPDVDDPVDPEFSPVFERGVSLVTGKRWKDMTEPEKIAHAYMRGESSWYGDKEGTPEWDEAMSYIDEKFGDRAGDYMSAFRAEAIERAMAGNAGFTVEETLENAGYNSLEDFMNSDTSSLQRELLGERDYFSLPDEYSPEEAKKEEYGSPKSSAGAAGASGPGLTLGGASEVSGPDPDAIQTAMAGKGGTGSQTTIPSPGSSAYMRMQREDPERLAQLEAERDAARAGMAATPTADPGAGPRPEGVSQYVWDRASSGTLEGLNPTSITRDEETRNALVEAGYGDYVDAAAEKGYEQRVAHYMANGATREEAEAAARQGMAEGGMTDKVMLRTPQGVEEVQAGGIANVPTSANASMPTEEEFNMLAAALMGLTEETDAIINMFVDKYGPEMFQQIRDMILRSSVPNAQTEGMIEGPGGGMDDMVNGMIGSEQPVAVSPGEYIVAADVVSGLGDGSSDAGAKELDAMMERVRMARGGTTEQAPPIDASRIMPA